MADATAGGPARSSPSAERATERVQIAPAASENGGATSSRAVEEDLSHHRFVAEWDDEGVFFYQAFSDEIAGWAIENQRFGGPHFLPDRMTWIKPSFAWVLYRAGYGKKDRNQSRVLKVKLPHEAVAHILKESSLAEDKGPGEGRIQWDPARDLWRGQSAVRKQSMENSVEPRKEGRQRAIQIGMKGKLSHFYVQEALSIEDVSELSAKVHNAHGKFETPEEESRAMQKLRQRLPQERVYMPRCAAETLARLRVCQHDAAAVGAAPCTRTSPSDDRPES